MGSITMNTHHKRLQHYNRHYGSSCMTGTFGCRWHRYQQSKDNTSKWDLCWFIFLLLVYAYITIWFYFWLICGQNDYNFINWEISMEVGKQYDWYRVIIATCSTGFAYLSLLVLLSILHVANGHELYMHYVHKCMVFLTAAGCITATVIVNNVYPQGWTLAYISLQVYGPFLHIGAVVVMTLLSWILARQWLRLYKTGARFFWMGVFICLMVCLFVSPLIIESPCISDAPLPKSPMLQAHRGASAIYPENTLLAYRYASELPQVLSLETEIQISYDGIPFAMHDMTLERTTDVVQIYPQKYRQPAAYFNMSEIKQLDAGSWFLKTNPHGTVSQLSKVERELVKNATVPTLAEILALISATNKSVMINLRDLPANHPHAANQIDIVVDTIKKSGIDPAQVFWPDWDLEANQTVQLTSVSVSPVPPDELLLRNVHMVSLQYDLLDWESISLYHSMGIDVSISPSNSEWMYSLMWCGGVNVTSTDHAPYLSSIASPLWKWEKQTYFIIWLTVDIVAAFLITTIFVIQWFRYRGQMFNPETVLLQAAQQRVTHMRRNKNMKEKLIHAAEGLQETEQGIVGMQIAETPVGDGEAIASTSDISNVNSTVGFVRSGSSTPSIQSINDIKLREIQAVNTRGDI